MSIRAFSRLIRFPLPLTASADSLTGAFIIGIVDVFDLVSIAACSFFLYSAGMIFNDVADIERDRSLHPDRPLPLGQIKKKTAILIACIFMIAGVILTAALSLKTLYATIGIIFGILGYDFFVKKDPFVGPVFIGSLRALNFSISFHMVDTLGSLSIFVIFCYWLIIGLYTFIITLLSTLEEKPSRPLFIICVVLLCLNIFAVYPVSGFARIEASILLTILLLILLFFLTLKDFNRQSIMKFVLVLVVNIVNLDAIMLLSLGRQEALIILGLLLLIILSLRKRGEAPFS